MKVEVYMGNDADRVLVNTYHGTMKEVLRKSTFLAAYSGYSAELTQENKIQLCKPTCAGLANEPSNHPGVWISATLSDPSAAFCTEVMVYTGWTQARAVEKIAHMLQLGPGQRVEWEAGLPGWKLVEPGDKFSVVMVGDENATERPSTGQPADNRTLEKKFQQDCAINDHPEDTMNVVPSPDKPRNLTGKRRMTIFVYNNGVWVSHQRHTSPEQVHEDQAFLCDFNGRVVDYRRAPDALFVSGAKYSCCDGPGVWVDVRVRTESTWLRLGVFTGWSVQQACDAIKRELKLPPGKQVVWADERPSSVFMYAIFRVVDAETINISNPADHGVPFHRLEFPDVKLPVFVLINDKWVPHERYTTPELAVDTAFICDFNGRIVEYKRYQNALFVSGSVHDRTVAGKGVWIYVSVWTTDWPRVLVHTAWSESRVFDEDGQPGLCLGAKLRVVDVTTRPVWHEAGHRSN